MQRRLDEGLSDSGRIRYLAHHDPLTGLLNRVDMWHRTEQAIVKAGRGHWGVAVLFLDLDDFKRVNEALGHPVGDRLLQTVAERLESCVRPDDAVARFDGDEFAVTLARVYGRQAPTQVARRILGTLPSSLMVEDREIGITGCIGISLYPEHGQDVSTLLERAGAAMQLAKQEGPGSFSFHPAAATQATHG